MATLTFQTERWRDVLPELQTMFAEHSKDTHGMPVELDMDIYNAMDGAGQVHVVTARDDGWLVGYVIAFLKTHLHSKSIPCCFVDSFYLRPEYRYEGSGQRLLQALVDSVRGRKIYLATTVKMNIDRILRSLGFVELERVYVMEASWPQ